MSNLFEFGVLGVTSGDRILEAEMLDDTLYIEVSHVISRGPSHCCGIAVRLDQQAQLTLMRMIIEGTLDLNDGDGDGERTT